MEQKRLMRSRKDVVIAGVCGGIAEYFNADPTLVRLLFVVATVFHGVGLIAYLVMWLVVPQAPALESGGGPSGEPAAREDKD